MVAVKQVHTLSDSDWENFKGEAQLMSNLRPHSNVVQFLGITSTPSLCIITEFMDGGSLYSVLHSDAKIDMSMVQIWVQGIAAGMFHLHSEGVFHRDLASRNVLLNSGGQAKIADFGLSRTGSGAKISQTASQTGPLKWMAPESIRNRIYSIHSDVWSFGVTLWEIVSREDPYPDLDPVQTALQVTQGDPPLRLVSPSYCPHLLTEIMNGCFASEPTRRPDFKMITQRLKTSRAEEWAISVVGRRDVGSSQYGAMPDVE